MSDGAAPIARFDFANGALRGSHLVLYSGCLVHRSDAHLETLPLTGLASVKVSFERNTRFLAWAGVLVLVALILLLVAAPLARWSGLAAGELASGSTGVAAVLQAVFRLLELVAGLLPVFAALLGLGGAALAALGWMGTTTLTVAFAAQERDYPARGRNTRLLDFSELLAEQVVNSKK